MQPQTRELRSLSLVAGARSPSDVGPVAADFVKPGIMFGYRTISEYGSFSDGEGNIYNFGRSSQRCMLDLQRADGEEAGDWARRQKDMLKNKMRRTGLNAPCRLLMWVRVPDIDKFWDDFKEELAGWGSVRRGIEGTSPLITQQCVVGDNYYTVANMNVTDFGNWCNAVSDKMIAQ